MHHFCSEAVLLNRSWSIPGSTLHVTYPSAWERAYWVSGPFEADRMTGGGGRWAQGGTRRRRFQASRGMADKPA
eukprot:1161941-Pelagomonas_calceolata.AAC.6